MCGLQGGDDVYRLNALILSCAVGAAYSLNKQCRKQEAESEQVISSTHSYSLMYSQPTFKVILKPEYVFP